MAITSYAVLCIVILGPLLFIFYKKWKLTYWKRRGVETPERQNKQSQNKYIRDIVVENYQEFKSKGLQHGGIYKSVEPWYLPVDLELVKSIMQKDFEHFHSHGIFTYEEVDPLSGQLFNLEGEKWRNLRTKLTPTFTSGKIKMMFQTVVNSSTPLVEILNEYAKIGDAVDIKEILCCYSTDIISSCAFGLDSNSMKNPQSKFREYGKKYVEMQMHRMSMNNLIMNVFPRSLLCKMGYKFDNKDVENFFITLVKQIVEYREKNNITRKDFMHLLLQLKNIGRITDDDTIKDAKNSTSHQSRMTVNEMAAQCAVFFAAGFETSSTAMTFALLELAQNQDIQQKLREEIIEVLNKYDNEITYDAITEMVYLEQVFNETSRKHPILPFLSRKCTKDYQVPGTDVIIERGTKVILPVFPIHRDPEYYPDPEKFDPERFNEQNKAKIPSFAFLPFGEGPRICIGMRFAKMQTKVGLATIIRNFKVTLHEKTKTPVKYGPELFLTETDDDIWLRLSKLE